MESNSTATKILDFLLDHPGGAAAASLVEHLGITKTAVREHLEKLHEKGYITFRDERGTVGRPKRFYCLTSAGHEALPRQYSWLSLIMLEHLVRTTDEAFTREFMAGLADHVASSLKGRMDGVRNSRELIRRISEILSELGYRASIKQSDLRKGAVVEATNCVYHSVAQRYPQLCRFDTRLIENLSGLNVRMTRCIAKGDSACSFCLEKKRASPAQPK